MHSRHSLKAAWMVSFILVALAALPSYSSEVAAGTEENDAPLVILYDLGHGQFFNQTLYFKALDSLKSELSADWDVEIRYSYGNFNSSILSGVDVLVMTNPGETTSLNDQDVNERNSQLYALAHWFLQGKGIFLLSNPYDQSNASLSGNPESLVRVLRNDYLQIGGVDIRANYLARDSVDVINGIPGMNEFLNINTSLSPILSDPHNVSTIVTKSATVRASEEGTAVGKELIKSNFTSLAVAEDGKVEEVDREPCIFATIEYEPTEDDYEIAKDDIADPGRIALSGSTIMFSDLLADPGGDSSSWLDLGNNKHLWINTISWLAGERQSETPAAVEDEDFPFFSIVGILGLSTIGLFVLGTGAHLYGASKPIEPVIKAKKEKEAVEKGKERRPTAKKPKAQLRRKKK
ncbi:MAG: hypothetical protein ACXACI_12485 [Candidatus Hodarchaeales archaeon]